MKLYYCHTGWSLQKSFNKSLKHLFLKFQSHFINRNSLFNLIHSIIPVENKQYPRERSRERAYRGRIRIQLRNDDGTPFIEKYPTRDSILVLLGEMIPQLKSRQTKSSSGQENQPQGGQGKKNKKKK